MGVLSLSGVENLFFLIVIVLIVMALALVVMCVNECVFFFKRKYKKDYEKSDERI